MQKVATRQLLRRHTVAFVVAFASLTAILLANIAVRRVPSLSARGDSTGTILEMLLLALPFIAALTIPMAVFVAASWVFTRLGAEGVLEAAQQERTGVRRLLAPVLLLAAVVAVLTLVSNTQVLPRANARLADVFAGEPRQPTDRTMTVPQLREAARRARSDAAPDAQARAGVYEVEIQKKFALAAASMILALAGAVIPLRFPRGRVKLVFGASAVVFTGYYIAMIAGESLADRQMLSPFVSMWMANALLLAIALLLLWRPGRLRDTEGPESLAIGA